MMPTKPKQKKNSESNFVDKVREALDSYSQHKKLGMESPLAQPYFLGNQLQSTDTTPEARGQALARLLREIILEDITDPLHRTILTRRYLEGEPVRVLLVETGYKRARYNDHQNEAIEAVGLHLVQKVKRTLYLENPPIPPRLFARDESANLILEYLKICKDTAPKSVILAGSGGMGKTTLGGEIAKTWQEKRGPIFWYTIRPGLTDQLSALLFNLAYFLDQQGQSIPWLELVSKQGAIEPQPMLGLMRAAISKLEKKPLLCFDELDMLDAEQSEHARVIEFINSLRGTASMLWIGQQIRLEADHIETLDGFSLDAIGEFCKEYGIHLTREQRTQLQMDTQGNPRLLNLFVALYQTGENLEIALDDLHKSPSVEYLLNRILIRLDKTEQKILRELALFRGSAPSHIWQQDSLTGVALQKIVERRLVREDQHGLVSLLPAYHRCIVADLSDEEKILLHRKAANVRSQTAEYTEAMYHLAEAELPDLAIQLWHKYEQQEINRGQSGAALAILETLKKSDLSNNIAKKLHNSCANLRLLHGDMDLALQDLRINLSASSVLDIEALEIEGQIENNLNNFPQAQAAFNKALAHAEHLIESRLSLHHKGLGWSYMRDGDLKLALQESELASYESDNFRAYVLERLCRYQEAERTYLSALERADKLMHTQGIAKTANNLARFYAILGQFDRAKQYHSRAQDAYRKAGEFIGMTGCDINLALIHTISGEYTLGLETLEAVEKQWQGIWGAIQPWQKSLIELMRAEIYVYIEEWDAAEASLKNVFNDEEIMDMADALRVQGELCLGQGNHDAAKISIQDSVRLSRDQANLHLEAYAHRAMGKVHQSTNNHEEAKTAFDQAIQLFTELELQHEVDKTEQLSNP